MPHTPLPALRPGDQGDAVRDVQSRLIAVGYPISPDERGRFGPQTASAVKAFQVRRGLVPDGVIEDVTWRELVEAGWTLGSRMLYFRFPAMRGDDVRELQRCLNALGFDAGKDDGIFGRATDDATREFQRNMGLPADGQVGRETVAAVQSLRRRIGPGSKSQLRERIAREQGVGVGGRTVYLDPGHGGPDAGVLTTLGIPESYVVYRVAEATAARLAALGATPVVSREVQQGPGVDRRAESANDLKADVALSFHLACRPEPGPTVAFFSVDRSSSKMGRELAESISEALRPRLGRGPGVLGRNLPFLRQTAMPAIVVDLASPGTDALLGEDAYLGALGDAVAAGVESYFT